MPGGGDDASAAGNGRCDSRGGDTSKIDPVFTGASSEARLDNRPLVLDLVEWLAERPRDYDSVMAIWRTSCPQLTIWEDAIDAGLVRVASGGGSRTMVNATDTGIRFLHQHGRGKSSADVEQE